ncbi:MAG TPA: hypothetical protein EYQ64_03350, partial [Gemmatimonadetes bacterium]|nr:hypothetical protein [Gemmatimonadota bacterium]
MSAAKQPKAQQATVFEPMDMSTAEAVLKEIKQILDRLGLVFFLRHGTCLGAVRDHAFIEWDDDLEVDRAVDEEAQLLELEEARGAVLEQRCQSTCAKLGGALFGHRDQGCGCVDVILRHQPVDEETGVRNNEVALCDYR